MAYSKAKLKSNGDRASPCFKPFLILHTSLTLKNSAVGRMNLSLAYGFTSYKQGIQGAR